MALLQALNLLFHLLSFTREIFVVIGAPPDSQSFGAGGDPVNLFLLGFMAQRIAGISLIQRLTGSAAGQGEGMQGFVAQDPTRISYSIQSDVVMRHQNETPLPGLQEAFQPQESRQVEVVSRFVQQQEIRLLNQRPGKQQPGMLTAAQG